MAATTPRIVVGIDDTPASATGVKYAALEAQRLGAELDIVHATPGYGDLHGDVPLVDDQTLAAFGHKLLRDAEVLARSMAPNLSVRSTLKSGGAVTTLVDSARGALMLVLGAERRSFVGRIWTGDVVGGAAARSHCPVVVVAPEWDPSEEHGRILVGLKSPGEARELLAAGLDLAHECKAELVVVHAWKLKSGYDDIVANRADSDEYGRRATSEIEPVINELRLGTPGGRRPHRGAPRPGRVRAGQGFRRRRPSADLPAGARNRPSPPRASRPSGPARSALPRRDPPATQGVTGSAE